MTDQQQLIDQYLSGRGSSDEVSAFEQRMSKDPLLRKEVDFQKEIIDGLKDYRKMQLKSRLEAIDVAPNWFEFAQQSALVKSFSGVAVATLIGTGIYLFANEEPVTKTSVAPISIDAPSENEALAYKQEILSIPDMEETEQSKIAETVKIDKKIVALQKMVVDPEPVSVNKPSTTFNLDFSVPIVGDAEDEIGFSSTSLDEVSRNPETGNETNSKPDVEIENSKSNKIKYKYYDGKLFLSGNFNKQPYEILEINSTNGRRIYLLYHDKFYEIGITDRLSDLPEVVNKELVQKLRSIRENK